MLNKIKSWLLARVKSVLLAEIARLDQYESVVAGLITQQLHPTDRAREVIAFAQGKLTDIVNKAFSWKWLGSVFFKTYKDQALSEIQALSKYEPDIVNLINSGKPEDLAKTLISAVKVKLTDLVNKNLK